MMKIHKSLFLHLIFLLPLCDAFLVPRPMLVVKTKHEGERMIVSNNPTRLQVKHGFGGFVDVEEIVTMKPVERFFPFIAKLMEAGTPGKSRDVLSFLRSETPDLRQILVFASVAYILPILGRYRKKEQLTKNGKDYHDTKTYHVLNHISQGCALSAIITFGESILQFFLGYNNQFTTIATTTASSICFGIWGMYRMKFLKNIALILFCNRFRIHSKMLIRFYKRVTNYVLYLVTSVIILDSLGFKYQKAVSAISVFGGFGTLIFSLASKDIASQLLSGFSMSLSEPFVVGDKILLNDGSVGIVEKAGPLRTIIRGEDEILLNMPNAELENMRFCNLSTVSTSQVKQEFRVAFSDIDQISLLVKNIKSEIEKCPCVIKDGSRPFRVHFTSFGGKSYVISTDVRLNVPPYSDEYYDNREKVLQAIAKAANSCDVTFQ